MDCLTRALFAIFDNGISLLSSKSFFRVKNSHICIVHDDLDLKLGTSKINFRLYER